MLIEQTAAANTAASDDFARTGLAVLRNGFSPVPIYPGSKAPTIPHYSHFFEQPPSFAQVEEWQSAYPDHGLGVCLGYRGLLCIKIDARGAELSREVADLVQGKLRSTPLVRSGAEGSLALFFRLDGAERKRLDPVQLAGTVDGSVSFWLEGMQVVAFGAHSQTGQAYGWLAGSPENTSFKDVPVVTRKALVRAMKAVKGRFGRKNSNALPTDLPPIVRDMHTGKVMAGHETYLRQLVYELLYGFFQVYAVTSATSDKLREIAEAASSHFNQHAIDAPRAFTKVKRAEDYVRQTIVAAGSDVVGFFNTPTRDEFVTALADTEDPEGSLYNPVAIGRGREITSDKIGEEVATATAINIQREHCDEQKALSDLPFSNVTPPIFYNSFRRRALKVTTGVGKSTAMRNKLMPFLNNAAARAEGREGATIYGRAMVLVPDHKLAREWVANLSKALEDTPFTVAHAGGRHTEHPDRIGEMESNGTEKVGYCDESKSGLTKALASKGFHNEQIDNEVCASCPLIEACRYHTQKPAVGEADVVVSVHNYLNSGAPDFWGEGFGLVIVDEDCSSMAYVDDKERTIAINELAADLDKFPVYSKGIDGQYYPDAAKTSELNSLTQVLAAWLTSQAGQDGPIDLVACPLDVQQLERMKSLNWARCLSGVPPVDEAVLKKYPSRAYISRRSNVVTSILFAKQHDEHRRKLFGHYGARLEGASVKVLMSNRPHHTLSMTPILALDASYSPAMAGEYLRPVALLAEVEARADQRHVTQFKGQFGMRNIYSKENVERIVGKTKQLGGSNGVFITTKEAEPIYKAALSEVGLADVPMLHHGALAGLDTFGKVDWLVIAGFTRLSQEALVAKCRDRGHEPVTEKHKAYVYDPKPGGGKQMRAVRQWVDPMMQELDAAFQIACLAQAEGRGRAVNRGPDNPLKVLVFGLPSCAMPFAVDEFIDRELGDPTGDKMLDLILGLPARGVMPLSAPVVAKLFPSQSGERLASLRRGERVLSGIKGEADQWAGGDILAFLKMLTNRDWRVTTFSKKGQPGRPYRFAIPTGDEEGGKRTVRAFMAALDAQ